MARGGAPELSTLCRGEHTPCRLPCPPAKCKGKQACLRATCVLSLAVRPRLLPRWVWGPAWKGSSFTVEWSLRDPLLERSKIRYGPRRKSTTSHTTSCTQHLSQNRAWAAQLHTTYVLARHQSSIASTRTDNERVSGNPVSSRSPSGVSKAGAAAGCAGSGSGGRVGNGVRQKLKAE